MSQFYTLKKFYTKAKAIVEKLDIPNKEIFKIDVDFTYTERRPGEEFDCLIKLDDEKHYLADDHIEIFICNNSNPDIVLLKFENEIIKKFNLYSKPIYDPSSEGLAIELPDPDTPTTEA